MKKIMFSCKHLSCVSFMRSMDLLKRSVEKLESESIHTAAYRDQINESKILLDAHVVVNTRDKHGLTALHWAGREGSYEAVVALVICGAQIQACCENQQTPLEYAKHKNYRAICQLLEKAQLRREGEGLIGSAAVKIS